MRCKIPSQDLAQRLDNTLCCYRGRPFLVRYVESNVLNLHTLASGKRSSLSKQAPLTIRSDDPDFDVSTPPLGYVQFTPTKVSYLSRKPIRIYKQGLTNDVIFFQNIPSAPELQDNPGEYFDHTIFCEQFENMVLGRYPSLETVFKFLSEGTTQELEVAISRDVALKYKPKLELIFVYFKGNEVGWMSRNSRRVMIPKGDMSWVISKHLRNFSWEVE